MLNVIKCYKFAWCKFTLLKTFPLHLVEGHNTSKLQDAQWTLCFPCLHKSIPLENWPHLAESQCTCLPKLLCCSRGTLTWSGPLVSITAVST